MNKNISSYSLDRQSKLLKKDIIKKISKVIDHNQFINGPENKILENRLKKLLNVENCVLVSSGTDALLISLMAIGLKEGDEVITTPFTFISTIEVILSLKAVPVLVDIDSQTFNIDATKIEKVITNRTKVIMPVSLFGQTANLREIKKITRNYKKIKIVEDNAQSLLSKHNDKYSHNYCDISCTSFFPTKIFGCYGDGGAILLKNKRLALKIRKISNHGSINKKTYDLIGLSGRMDTMQSSILLAKLNFLKKEITQRIKIAKFYDIFFDKLNSDFNKKLILKPEILRTNKSIYSQYTIKTKYRDKIKKFLYDNKISSLIYYENLVIDSSYYKKKCNFQNITNAKKIKKSVLSLPINGYQNLKETKYICDKILLFFKNLN